MKGRDAWGSRNKYKVRKPLIAKLYLVIIAMKESRQKVGKIESEVGRKKLLTKILPFSKEKEKEKDN